MQGFIYENADKGTNKNRCNHCDSQLGNQTQITDPRLPFHNPTPAFQKYPSINFKGTSS